MKEYKIGYTQGTFDMFHIGHLNLIRQAKTHCEKLIVGVNSDNLVWEYKRKHPVIGENERVEIIKALRYVDEVIICDTLKKTTAWETLHFDAIFIGDDWKGNKRWEQTELDLSPLGAKVVYLSHTDGISSSLLRTQQNEKVSEDENTI